MVVAQMSAKVPDVGLKKKVRRREFWVEESERRGGGWLEVELESRKGRET